MEVYHKSRTSNWLTTQRPEAASCCFVLLIATMRLMQYKGSDWGHVTFRRSAKVISCTNLHWSHNSRLYLHWTLREIKRKESHVSGRWEENPEETHPHTRTCERVKLHADSNYNALTQTMESQAEQNKKCTYNINLYWYRIHAPLLRQAQRPHLLCWDTYKSHTFLI